jgi:hypothetical protein
MTDNSQVKVINCFTYEGGQIIELQFCNIAEGSAKEHMYQWYLIHACYRSDLRFISRLGNERVFTFTDVFNTEMTWTVVINTDAMTMQLSHNKNPYSSTVHKITE